MTCNETRAALLRTGGDIIARQGYNNTGINSVLCAAGVPKGSFYYYFATKEDFGLAVIDDFAAEYAARLGAVLGDPTASPLQRIRNYFVTGAAEVVAHDYGHGCLIGNLGQELAGQNEVFRQRLHRIFQTWISHFADCLTAARDAGEIDPQANPEELAEFLLSGWEGAILRSKVAKSEAPMTAFAELFLERVLKAK